VGRDTVFKACLARPQMRSRKRKFFFSFFALGFAEAQKGPFTTRNRHAATA